MPRNFDRCRGVGDDTEGWREDCADCLRRTSPPVGCGQIQWMEPEEVIVFICPWYIGPSDHSRK